MTAKQNFKRIGYKQTKITKDEIIYQANAWTIKFNLSERLIFTYFEEKPVIITPIGIDELKAIICQCEELKWL